MSQHSYPIRPYAEWPHDEQLRWINAGNTFGAHLFQHVRDNAICRIAAETALDVEQSKRAVDVTLRTIMDLLDGYYRPTVGESHLAEYVLLVRIRDADGNAVETVELAPDGDGLAMGYAGWERGDFGQDTQDAEREAA